MLVHHYKICGDVYSSAEKITDNYICPWCGGKCASFEECNNDIPRISIDLNELYKNQLDSLFNGNKNES